MDGGDAIKSKESKGFFQKFYSLIQGVQKAGLYFRKSNLQGNPREAGTGSDIHDCFYLAHIYGFDAAEAVQEMFHENLVKFCDTGQVHDFIFFYKVFVELDELVFLRIIESNSKFLAAFFKDF